MTTVIAKADREAMNALYAQVTKKAAEFPTHTDQAVSDHAEESKTKDQVLKEDAKDMKLAAKNEGWTDQAFADHKEYLETLEGILSDDQKETWDPNDPTKD